MDNQYYDEYAEEEYWDDGQDFPPEDDLYEEVPPTQYFRVSEPGWEYASVGEAPWYVFTFPSPGCILGVLLAFIAALSFLLISVTSNWKLPMAQVAVLDGQAGVAEVLPEAVVEAETTGFIASPDAAAAPCEVSDLFPKKVLRWCNLISYYARNQNLDPDLVAALVWLESGGNEVAYSRSGAVGLMQVMPKDGLAASFMCINGPCFSDRPSIEELQNPEFNIKYGTRMLARLLNKHGDVREALKSYGPMNVGYYYADKVLGLFNQYGAAP